MNKTLVGCLCFCLVAPFISQGQVPLCPRHIETPGYPAIARTANITGKVTLTITIDAAGKVTSAEVKADTPSRQAHPVLQKSAAENIRRWTFVEPPSAPHSQEIAFDYEIDGALPPSGGPSNSPSITKATFDLPDHVTISTNGKIIDSDKSRAHD